MAKKSRTKARETAPGEVGPLRRLDICERDVVTLRSQSPGKSLFGTRPPSTAQPSHHDVGVVDQEASEHIVRLTAEAHTHIRCDASLVDDGSIRLGDGHWILIWLIE